MRIRVLSDLHLEFAPFDPPAADADVVVLAGDIDNGATGMEWAKDTFAVPVLYLAGNHEYYGGEFGEVQGAMLDASRDSVVRFLDCTECVIGGVRFLGCTLWTDYSLAPEAERAKAIEDARRVNPDYSLVRRGERKFSPEDAIRLFREHRGWLEARLATSFPGKTVVITHFAPHPKSIAAAYANHPANPGFVVDLEPLMGPAALWIHGHTHTFFDYRMNGTRVVCNPRGYPGESTGFRADWTVEV